jgi:hypothetical protein
VADAQQALDEAALERLTAVATADGEIASALRAIGYQPTWYRIPELTADISLSLTLAAQSSSSAHVGPRLYATPIDASFSNRYVVHLEATSRVSFKVVPVPPSPLADELAVVPALVGMQYHFAAAALDEIGVAHERTLLGSDVVGADSDLVDSTTPGPGELVKPGTTVRIFTIGAEGQPA